MLPWLDQYVFYEKKNVISQQIQLRVCDHQLKQIYKLSMSYILYYAVLLHVPYFPESFLLIEYFLQRHKREKDALLYNTTDTFYNTNKKKPYRIFLFTSIIWLNEIFKLDFRHLGDPHQRVSGSTYLITQIFSYTLLKSHEMTWRILSYNNEMKKFYENLLEMKNIKKHTVSRLSKRTLLLHYFHKLKNPVFLSQFEMKCRNARQLQT